jgi:hypothetical protein
MLLEQLILLLKQIRINDYGLHWLIFKKVHWFRGEIFLKGLKQAFFVPALGRGVHEQNSSENGLL